MNSDIISGTAKYPEYLKFNTQFTRSEEIEPGVYWSKQLPLTNRVEEVATPETSLIVIDGELHPVEPSLDLTPDEARLYLYNIQHHEEEPEDTILANSDILLKLLEQAKQEPPSNDWERELDEL